MEALVISHWHWLILAITLLVVEVLTATAFFLWLSAAAAAVAAVVYFQPGLIWQYQLALASLFIILSIVLWKMWGKWFPKAEREDNQFLNRRSEQYIGRVFVLSQAIENGIGKVIVDDSTWRVSGEDAAVNSRVKVVGADGMLLKVEVIE